MHQQLACICPVFLGIVDNVTFLYDTRYAQWLVMHQPVIVRNETRGPQIKSTLLYEQARFSVNPLYRNYRRYIDQTLRGESTLRHYASYEVAYDGGDDKDGVNEMPFEYKLYETRLRDYDTATATAVGDEQERSVLMSMSTPPRRRRRTTILLDGEQAICFNFCQHANKQFVN